MKRAKQRKRTFAPFFMLIEPTPWAELAELRPVGKTKLMMGEIGTIDCGFILVKSPRSRS
jgi:hypothetical protein